MVNAFGTGVADDKLVHAYVEEMVRFYLGEEPLVESVETYDLGDPEVLDERLRRGSTSWSSSRAAATAATASWSARASAPSARDRGGARSPRGPSGFVAQETVDALDATRPSATAGSSRATSTCGRS